MNGICGIFDMKSNYFSPVIPKIRFEKLDEMALNAKTCFYE